MIINVYWLLTITVIIWNETITRKTIKGYWYSSQFLQDLKNTRYYELYINNLLIIFFKHSKYIFNKCLNYVICL